ncbi:ATP-binding protein [Oceanospirillum maris]|uniref:ATP-binding protein n=1 Tax=Oceanospirillum maris TaxID=64977 RepID=UPI00041E43E1|nr:ATP-binding protein [Oceanospirillum maris]
MSSINSGDGERTAMLGYVPQYEIAAGLIYEALLDGSLEWFRVADPDAGSLDDILIATTGRLDAYQVKWAEYTDAISYADFVRDSTTKKGEEKLSLFRQLTEGWEHLNEHYKERTVRVHLLHKLVPSSNPKAQIPLGDTTPQHAHFQSFLKECWFDRTWCETGLDKSAVCWKEVLLDLQQRSNFNDDQFLNFIRCCELEFNYKRPADIPVTNQGQARKQEDIEKIYNLLTKMAGGERRIIELSKDDMLDRMAWSHRFKHKFVHEFPIDRTYQEIEDTVGSIFDVLSHTKQGYVALLGTPGSGKSTTLTHALKYKAGYKLVRYYAYVPDSTYQGRGEATTFLHDITLSLRNHGFRGESSGQPGSREEYLSLLGEQLQQAHEKWKNDGVTTVIMVDGLDHIQREQNPLQSLLSDLPSPNTVPDGVIFVLGSQTLELNDLSDRIKEHVSHESRTIAISPLTRTNVYAAINQWPGCSELTDSNKKKIFEKSLGHPLSLVYLLQFINSSSDVDYDEAIDDFPIYKGHIEQSYSVYWRQIESNQKFVDLLALLSRLRVPINTNVLEKWSDHSTIRDFISSAAHYFKKDSDVSWRFFHNSFRQFILDKTSRNLFGNFDDSKSIEYHKVLAKHCIQSSEDNDPMRWEAVYHLFNAREMEAVIDTGTQGYFRDQFFNLRNTSSLTDDIDAVLLSAKELNDPLAVVRSLLIEIELRERIDALNEVDELDLIFSTEGVSSALSYIFDGELLRVSDLEALKFSKVLAENKFFNEAKRVFESAEPLSYLSGGDAVDPHHGGAEDLKRWVDVAHYFMPLSEVVSTIHQTKYEVDDVGAWSGNDEDLHASLMRRLVNGIDETKDEGKIGELFSFLSNEKEHFDSLITLCFSICINQYPSALIGTAFEAVFDWSESDDLDFSEKLLVAELDYRANGSIEKTKEWFVSFEQPELYKHGIHGQWKNLSPFADSIRLNRLRAALGQGVDPVKVVPKAGEEKYTGSVLFERALVRFSSIWGRGWAGEKLLPSFIVKEIKSSFDLLRKPYNQTRDWIGWYEFESAAVDYFNFAIRATAQHGHDCILALADAFRKDWDNRYWPTGWRREIAFTLYKEGYGRDRLVDVLDQIEKEIPGFDDIHSKISEYYELSIMWSKIGKPDRAASLLPKIFKNSFGIYHRKDRQFSHWVSWLGKLIKQYPDLAYDEICRFSLALVNLEQSGNGRGTQEAGLDLITIVTGWNPQYGLKLLRWLFDHKGLDYAPGLTGLLSGMLDSSSPPLKEISVMSRKLLIPFEEYNPSDLAKKLVSRCCQSSDNDVSDEVEELITSIKTHLLPSNRYSWLEGLALGVREAGLDNSFYASMAISTPQEKHVTHEPSLTLKSGEKLTDEEAQLKVNSSENLFQLLRTVESADYFRWMNLIQPFLKGMSVSQLEELHKLLKLFNPDNNVISCIASAFYSHGEADKANSLFEDLFDNSDAKGWDLNWDGGSRHLVFKALVEIDAKQWRPKALASLVDDYIGEYRYPSNLIWNLKEIVEILFEDEDVLPIWKEIKEHAYQLDAFEQNAEKSPALLDDIGEKEDASLLILFAFDMLDVAIPELGVMAHQAIVDLAKIEVNWLGIRRQISNRIDKIGLTQVKIMSLLSSLTKDFKEFVLQFKGEISSLCASEDFSVRMTALDLASRLEIEGKPPSEERSKLPLAYELELPEINNIKEAIPFSAIRLGETFPDVDDPIELLRPLLTEAKLVAKMSSVPFENLIYRASDFMKTLVPKNEWDKQAEEDYRNWLEGIGLKLTYHRLRPKVAKLALSYVVCELLDAGRIPPQGIELLRDIFKRSDELLLALEPGIRPECIVVPKAKDREISHKRDEWLEDTEQGITQFVDRLDTGKQIIGELTTWSWLDWDLPTEVRMSTVCHPEWNDDVEVTSPYAFFPSMKYWSASHYPKITFTDEPSLVIYGTGAYIDHGGLEWLALNPSIGFHLGWSVSDEGLFRWINENGDVMVESISWKDGPISRQPPKMDDLCSNGWLVVASVEAVKKLREFIGEASRVNAIVRSYGRGTYDPITSSSQQRGNW